MRVNGIKNQSFGMNPSNVIRDSLAEYMAKGKVCDEFIGLIKEIYPYRFMTAITEGDKFFWVGATRRFDYKPRMETYINVGDREEILEPVIKERYRTEQMYKYDKKYYDEMLAKYPSRTVIKDEEIGFVTFFKDVKGKLFDEIIEPIQAKLKAIKEGYNPKERAYLKIVNTFPEYKDIPDMSRVSDAAREAARSANSWHEPMTI